MNQIGKKIKSLRHQKDWNQATVAAKLSISIPAYSKMETGVTDLNISRITQIADLFEMSVVELLTFQEPDAAEEYLSDLSKAEEKLRMREAEVLDLQKKLINLYHEARVLEVS